MHLHFVLRNIFKSVYYPDFQYVALILKAEFFEEEELIADGKSGSENLELPCQRFFIYLLLVLYFAVMIRCIRVISDTLSQILLSAQQLLLTDL